MKSLNDFSHSTSLFESLDALLESLGNLEGLPKPLVRDITSGWNSGAGGANSPVELSKSKNKKRLLMALRNDSDIVAIVGKSKSTGEFLFGITTGSEYETRGKGKSLKLYTPEGTYSKKEWRSIPTTKYYRDGQGKHRSYRASETKPFDTTAMTKSDAYDVMDRFPSNDVEFYIYRVDQERAQLQATRKEAKAGRGGTQGLSPETIKKWYMDKFGANILQSIEEFKSQMSTIITGMEKDMTEDNVNDYMQKINSLIEEFKNKVSGGKFDKHELNSLISDMKGGGAKPRYDWTTKRVLQKLRESNDPLSDEEIEGMDSIED